MPHWSHGHHQDCLLLQQLGKKEQTPDRMEKNEKYSRGRREEIKAKTKEGNENALT